MIGDLFGTFCLIVAGILLYRFRAPFLDVLARFDRNNRDRIAAQERETEDPLSHFRHTLERADEQVEPVEEVTARDERLGTPVTRFVFDGQHFSSREAAERARAEKVRAVARDYYRELPLALRGRGDGRLN